MEPETRAGWPPNDDGSVGPVLRRIGTADGATAPGTRATWIGLEMPLPNHFGPLWAGDVPGAPDDRAPEVGAAAPNRPKLVRIEDGPEGSSNSDRPDGLTPAPTGVDERRNDGTDPAARINPVDVDPVDEPAAATPAGAVEDAERGPDEERGSTAAPFAAAPAVPAAPAAITRDAVPAGRDEVPSVEFEAPTVEFRAAVEGATAVSADAPARDPTTANVLLRTGSPARAPATRAGCGAATLRRRSAFGPAYAAESGRSVKRRRRGPPTSSPSAPGRGRARDTEPSAPTAVIGSPDHPAAKSERARDRAVANRRTGADRNPAEEPDRANVDESWPSDAARATGPGTADAWTALPGFSDTLAPVSRHALREYLAHAGADFYEVRQLRLVLAAGGAAVGVVDLFGFEPLHQRAGVGITVLKSQRRHGYAGQALALLKTHARDVLRLHQLHATVGADNGASLSLFRKAGFRRVGVRREWLRGPAPGQWLDAVEWQLLLH